MLTGRPLRLTSTCGDLFGALLLRVLTRRRISIKWILLIVFQSLVVVCCIVSYASDRWLPPPPPECIETTDPQMWRGGRCSESDSTSDDSDECRDKFASDYNDMCRSSLRPLPSNFINTHIAVGRQSTVDADRWQQQTGDTRQPKKQHDQRRNRQPATVNLCPCVPDALDHRVRVNFNENVTWSQLMQTHGVTSKRHRLLPSGRWTPLWCIPRHRIAVLIPFRGREQHLSVFLNNIHPFLRAQLLDYTIFVVEQREPELFNRGALLNVGFVEAMKHSVDGSFDCVILHDVDLIPENRHNFYVCSTSPRHMAAYRSGWNYRLTFSAFFGGVNSFRPDHFQLINGFSNKFYGWGGEDDDLGYRVVAKNLTFHDRFPKCVSKYAEKTHERDKGNPTGTNKDSGTEFRPLLYDSDGLRSLSYSVVDYKELQLYTRIVVDLPPQPNAHTSPS